MSETGAEDSPPERLLSVDDARPSEEGGPTARSGFRYQDEIAVGFLIEMLGEPSLIKVHCETHDDIVLVRSVEGSSTRIAEFVQVKANEPDKLWSMADLCKKDRPGLSVFETSLRRDDNHSERSHFRIVTLRPVVSELKVLTFPLDSPSRQSDRERIPALQSQLESRFPNCLSPKGNGSAYWLENCYWDQRPNEDTVRRLNLLALIKLGSKECRPLLPEHAEVLLDELRQRARTAGDAKWEPNPGVKIITREDLREWWERRTDELSSGSVSPSGSRLKQKMKDAGLPDELIQLALNMRLDYAANARTPRYMEEDEMERLQRQAKSELLSLRSQFTAGLLALDSPGFHALCVTRMDAVGAEGNSVGAADRTAFLKGCMYDITDRCMHRFSESA